MEQWVLNPRWSVKLKSPLLVSAEAFTNIQGK
jgi:hypothetical protein